MFIKFEGQIINVNKLVIVITRKTVIPKPGSVYKRDSVNDKIPMLVPKISTIAIWELHFNFDSNHRKVFTYKTEEERTKALDKLEEKLKYTGELIEEE